MDRKKNIDPISIGELFKDNKSYHIPFYQRSYSWSSNQLDGFFDTVQKLSAIGNDDWYMGQIILHKRDKYWDIIDGQQRLITIFLCLVYLSQWEETRKRKSKSYDLNTVKESVYRILFSIRENQKIDESKFNYDNCRLKLSNEIDKRGMEQLFNEKFSDAEGTIVAGDKNQIIQNYRLVANRLKDLIEHSGIDQILSVIKERLIFISLTPPTRKTRTNKDAIDLFLASNQNTLPLSTPELVRTLFLSFAEEAKGSDNKSVAGKIAEKWDKEIFDEVTKNYSGKIIKDNKFTTFLTDFYQIVLQEANESLWNRSNPRFLFNKFKKKLGQEENVDKILEKMTNFALVYRDIMELNSDLWQDWGKSNIFYLLEETKLLASDRLTRIILAIHWYYREEKNLKNRSELVADCLNKMILVFFRVVTIKKKQSGIFDNFFDNCLDAIKQKNFEDFVKNNEFINDEFNKENTEEFFASLRNLKERKNDVYKFIFQRYYVEKIKPFNSINISFDKTTQVEHIYPQNAKEKDIDKELETIKFELGNITLITGSINSKISNNSWEEKKKDLTNLKEQCLLTKENSSLLKENNINAEIIKKRTEKLITDFKKSKIFQPKI